MAHNNKEIEIQVKLEQTKPLLDFLNAKAKFEAEKRQLDEYFSPPDHDFLAVRPVREWLRVREANGKYSINYKDWHFDQDGKSYYCDEFETKIEDVAKMRMLLAALNFKSIAVVDKLRKTWNYQDYEIALDSVKNLGDYVEIEYIGQDDQADPRKVTTEMITWLKDLGCGQITRNYVGYPFLILFPNEVKYEII